MPSRRRASKRHEEMNPLPKGKVAIARQRQTVPQMSLHIQIEAKLHRLRLPMPLQIWSVSKLGTQQLQHQIRLVRLLTDRLSCLRHFPNLLNVRVRVPETVLAQTRHLGRRQLQTLDKNLIWQETLILP